MSMNNEAGLAQAFDDGLNAAAAAASIISDYKLSTVTRALAMIDDSGLNISAEEKTRFALEVADDLLDSIRAAPHWQGHVMNDIVLAQLLSAAGAKLQGSALRGITKALAETTMRLNRKRAEREMARRGNYSPEMIERKNDAPRDIHMHDLASKLGERFNVTPKR